MGQFFIEIWNWCCFRIGRLFGQCENQKHQTRTAFVFVGSPPDVREAVSALSLIHIVEIIDCKQFKRLKGQFDEMSIMGAAQKAYTADIVLTGISGPLSSWSEMLKLIGFECQFILVDTVGFKPPPGAIVVKGGQTATMAQLACHFGDRQN